jgi:hypothetical protein
VRCSGERRPEGTEFEKPGGFRGVSESEREHRQVRGTELDPRLPGGGSPGRLASGGFCPLAPAGCVSYCRPACSWSVSTPPCASNASLRRFRPARNAAGARPSPDDDARPDAGACTHGRRCRSSENVNIPAMEAQKTRIHLRGSGQPTTRSCRYS